MGLEWLPHPGPRATRTSNPMAEWQSGYAADCNSANAGSIPASASKLPGLDRPMPAVKGRVEEAMTMTEAASGADGARGGARTRMALRPRDFKSLVSTGSTTRAELAMVPRARLELARRKGHWNLNPACLPIPTPGPSAAAWAHSNPPGAYCASAAG